MMKQLFCVFGRYIAGAFLKNTAFLLMGLMALIYLFDTLELIRRASNYDQASLSIVLQMGLLKLPEVVQILFPFAVLFGAMFTFWQLNRRQELVIARSAGMSVWQFLSPVLVMAIFIGVLQMAVLNPIGTLLVGQYERMEQQYLKRTGNQIAVFKEGLWLRQAYDGGLVERVSDSGVISSGAVSGEGITSESVQDTGHLILHAAKVRSSDWQLSRVEVLFFDDEDNFIKRLDAPFAALKDGYWIFEDPVFHYTRGYMREGDVVNPERFLIPTLLTTGDVEDSFASVATMSFWALPNYIQTLEETGFDPTPLKVQYQYLLSQPLFYIAMIILAASVSLRPPRNRGGVLLFSSGIFIGFVVFFVSSFFQALGASQQLPVILAAWSPAAISLLFGVSVLIHLEDG